MKDINKLALITSEIINIHEEPIINENAIIEISMKELLDICNKWSEVKYINKLSKIAFEQCDIKRKILGSLNRAKNNNLVLKNTPNTESREYALAHGRLEGINTAIDTIKKILN